LTAVKTDGEIPVGEVQDRDEVGVDTLPLDEWLSTRGGRPLAVAVTGVGTPATGDAHSIAIVDTDRRAVVADLADITPEAEKALAEWLSDENSPKLLHGAKAVFHMLDGRGF